MKEKLFTQGELRFDGSDYEKELDQSRLTGQIFKIADLMKDEKWRTLEEIESSIDEPQSSISAQLRNLRKVRFGQHTVNKRRRGDRTNGLFEYQLIINKTPLYNVNDSSIKKSA